MDVASDCAGTSLWQGALVAFSWSYRLGGSASKLQDLNLSSEDWVHVRGRFANVGDREVFMADRWPANPWSRQQGSCGPKGGLLSVYPRSSNGWPRHIPTAISESALIEIRPERLTLRFRGAYGEYFSVAAG
jgi:hypothetical protein